MDRIGRRGDAAIRHDLDELRALAQFLARGEPHIVDTIDDAPEIAEPLLHHLSPIVGPDALVAMAARLRQALAGDDQPRAVDHALLDRHDESEIGAAAIANGGEAALQDRFHDPAGLQRNQRGRRQRVGPAVDRRRDDMHMAVDEARHQRLAAKVDPLGGGVVDRLFGHLGDPTVDHEHVEAVEQLVAGGIEQPPAGEEGCAHSAASA